MINEKDIEEILNVSDKAVARAIVLMNESIKANTWALEDSKKESYVAYLATWINNGNSLSGSFLKGARTIAKENVKLLLKVARERMKEREQLDSEAFRADVAERQALQDE